MYGALSWTYAEEPPPVTGLFLVTCWLGARLEPKLSANIPNPAGQEVRIPVGHIYLQAFNYDLNLQQITDQLSTLIAHFNTRVADLIRVELDKAAEQRNVDKTQVHANVEADVFLAIKVQTT